MKYLNANLVLPDSLVKELQNYIQGEYIYIPMKKSCHRSWGEVSGYRSEIQKRNMEIIEKYRTGASIEELTESYFLSIHAIRKIIYEK
ncbi:CD3324 family protein [Oscillospiraceae bacterium PP1C4]